MTTNMFNFITGALPCTILIPGLFFIPESPRWLVWTICYVMNCTNWILLRVSFSFVHLYLRHLANWEITSFFIFSGLGVLCNLQAKMGMTEEFETSLQILRGYDMDIVAEANEIRVFSSLFSLYMTGCIC